MDYSFKSKLYLGLVLLAGLILSGCVMTEQTDSSTQLLKESNGKYYYISEVSKCKTHRLVAGDKLQCFDTKSLYSGALPPISAAQAEAIARTQNNRQPVAQTTRTSGKLTKKQKTEKSSKKVTSRRFGSHAGHAKGEFFHQEGRAIYAPDGSTCKKNSDGSYACTNGVVYRFSGKDKISGTDGRECYLADGNWQCKVSKKYVIKM